MYLCQWQFQDFPRGVPTLGFGALGYELDKWSPKKHEIKKKLVARGAHTGDTPLRPATGQYIFVEKANHN